MDVRYKGHPKQFMHAFWGVGQMSFVKHAIFVDKEAPALEDYQNLAKYILDRLNPDKIFISEGVVDQLDHSSPKQFEGGKLGVDATGDEVESSIEVIEDSELLAKVQDIDSSVVALKQYLKESKNPITVVAVKKGSDVSQLRERVENLSRYISIFVVVDAQNNDLDNPYMLIWRVVNNIDAKRDITLSPLISVDATNKDNPKLYSREWPKDTHCDREVLIGLKERGLIEFDEQLNREFGLCPFNIYEGDDE
jgi:4-hydroxy-3-polyprenylbenzoate decarboxylase